MDKKNVIIFATIFIITLAAALVLYNILGDKVEQGSITPDNNVRQNTGQSGDNNSNTVKAADFTVINEQGNKVRLSDYEGTPVVLNFWASWCSPCRSEMPHFNEVYLEKEGEIEFLMINVTDGQRETVKTAQNYISSTDYSFPVLYDTNQEASDIYGIVTLPTTIFIDRDGYVVATANRTISKELLLQGIDLISLSE